MGGEIGLWFYFRIEGASGTRITFDVRNANKLLVWPELGGVRLVYGTPGRWRRTGMPVRIFPDKGILRFTVPCADQTYVAFCYPYVFSDLCAFREGILADKRVREIRLIKSQRRYPVYVWELGNGPRGIWLTCRTHASESTSSFVLEGFLRAILLAKAGRQLLDLATVRTCPMLDVDNVESGAYGKFGPPCDPYMDWSSRPVLRTVRKLQEYFAGAPERPRLYIDIHAPEPCGSTYVCTWLKTEVSPAYGAALDAFCRRIHAESKDPLKLDLKRTKGYPGWFGGRINRSTQGYFRTHYGCLAMTFEISYHWSSKGAYPKEDDYRNFGHALFRGILASLREVAAASPQ